MCRTYYCDAMQCSIYVLCGLAADPNVLRKGHGALLHRCTGLQWAAARGGSCAPFKASAHRRNMNRTAATASSLSCIHAGGAQSACSTMVRSRLAYLPQGTRQHTPCRRVQRSWRTSAVCALSLTIGDVCVCVCLCVSVCVCVCPGVPVCGCHVRRWQLVAGPQTERELGRLRGFSGWRGLREGTQHRENEHVPSNGGSLWGNNMRCIARG